MAEPTKKNAIRTKEREVLISMISIQERQTVELPDTRDS
jgi:hypothetical protein